MYSTSADYKTAIANTSRQFTWSGTITLKDGDTIDLDTTNIAQGGISFNSELFDDDMPSVGGTCSAEVDITIITDMDRFKLYGATVEMTFSLLIDEDNNTYEDIPMGIYFVNEAERAGDKRIKLVCYDAMSKFEKEARVNTHGTPFQILSLCCQQCGVTLGDSEQYIEDNFVNGALELTSYVGDNNIATWRQCVGFVAAILCANAVINRDGELHLVSDSTEEYGSIDLYSSKRFSADIGDFCVGISGIAATNPDTGKEIRIDSIVQGAETKNIRYTLELGLNPLMPIDDIEIAQVIGRIRGELMHKYTTPFDASILSDPSFDLGDHVNLYDLSGTLIGYGVIAKISIKSSGGMTITGVGVFPDANSTNNERLISSKENEVNWDSTYYYDYKNSAAYTVMPGTPVQVINLVYNTGESTHVDFHGQVRATIEVSEQYDSVSDTYTYDDVVLTAKIMVDGEEQSYHPRWTFEDGVNTIDFLYFYKAAQETTGTITVWLSITGGRANIAIGDSIGYVCGANYKDDVVAVGITQNPTKTTFYVGEFFDYTGMVVQAQLKSGNVITITSGCELTPADGSDVPDVDHRTPITAEVLYKDLNNNKWVNNLTFIVRPENRLRNIAYFCVKDGSDRYVVLFNTEDMEIINDSASKMLDKYSTIDPNYSIRTSNAGVGFTNGRYTVYGSGENIPYPTTIRHIIGQMPTVGGYIEFYPENSSSTTYHFYKVSCDTTEDTPTREFLLDFVAPNTDVQPLGDRYYQPGGGPRLNYTGKMCLMQSWSVGGYDILAYNAESNEVVTLAQAAFSGSAIYVSVVVDEQDKVLAFISTRGQSIERDSTYAFKMVVYDNGEITMFDITSNIGLPAWFSTYNYTTYVRPRLYYDPQADEILLYVCYSKANQSNNAIETRCFRFSMDGHTYLGEVTLPETITVDNRTVTLTGTTTSGITAYTIFNPFSNYGYYDDEGNNKPYPYIIGYLSGNSSAPWNEVPAEDDYSKLIFIDNLYFNESDGNVIV